MFRSSTPESRLQARRDAVAIGATQKRLQARVASSRATAPLAVAGLLTFIISATELVESIRL